MSLDLAAEFVLERFVRNSKRNAYRLLLFYEAYSEGRVIKMNTFTGKSKGRKKLKQCDVYLGCITSKQTHAIVDGTSVYIYLPLSANGDPSYDSSTSVVKVFLPDMLKVTSPFSLKSWEAAIKFIRLQYLRYSDSVADSSLLSRYHAIPQLKYMKKINPSYQYDARKDATAIISSQDIQNDFYTAWALAIAYMSAAFSLKSTPYTLNCESISDIIDEIPLSNSSLFQINNTPMKDYKNTEQGVPTLLPVPADSKKRKKKGAVVIYVPNFTKDTAALLRETDMLKDQVVRPGEEKNNNLPLTLTHLMLWQLCNLEASDENPYRHTLIDERVVSALLNIVQTKRNEYKPVDLPVCRIRLDLLRAYDQLHPLNTTTVIHNMREYITTSRITLLQARYLVDPSIDVLETVTYSSKDCAILDRQCVYYNPVYTINGLQDFNNESLLCLVLCSRMVGFQSNTDVLTWQQLKAVQLPDNIFSNTTTNAMYYIMLDHPLIKAFTQYERKPICLAPCRLYSALTNRERSVKPLLLYEEIYYTQTTLYLESHALQCVAHSDLNERYRNRYSNPDLNLEVTNLPELKTAEDALSINRGDIVYKHEIYRAKKQTLPALHWGKLKSHSASIVDSVMQNRYTQRRNDDTKTVADESLDVIFLVRKIKQTNRIVSNDKKERVRLLQDERGKFIVACAQGISVENGKRVLLRVKACENEIVYKCLVTLMSEPFVGDTGLLNSYLKHIESKERYIMHKCQLYIVVNSPIEMPINGDFPFNESLKQVTDVGVASSVVTQLKQIADEFQNLSNDAEVKKLHKMELEYRKKRYSARR